MFKDSLRLAREVTTFASVPRAPWLVSAYGTRGDVTTKARTGQRVCDVIQTLLPGAHEI